jgi:hypothetical protein
LGTFFDDNNPWNLAEIDSILKYGLGDSKVPGVN